MKKRWLALIMILVMGVCFSACNKNDDSNATQKLKDGITLNASFNYNGQKAEVKLVKSESDKYEVEVLSPSYLKGMVFSFTDNGTTVSYMGMSMDLEGDGLLAATMSKSIINCINSVTENTGITITLEDKNYIIDGENENGSFQMLLDKKSKLPTHLTIPSLGLECDLEKG